MKKAIKKVFHNSKRTPCCRYTCIYIMQIDIPFKPINRVIIDVAPVPSERRTKYYIRILFWIELCRGRQIFFCLWSKFTKRSYHAPLFCHEPGTIIRNGGFRPAKTWLRTGQTRVTTIMIIIIIIIYSPRGFFFLARILPSISKPNALRRAVPYYDSYDNMRV